MADMKISEMTHGATVDAAADLIPFVDVSDTTQGTGGSTKWLYPSQIQTTTFDAAAVVSGTLDPARIPATGMSLDAYTLTWGTATDAGTITFDIAAHAKWKVTLGGDRTLALSNAGTATQFTVALKQDSTGSRAVTWWSGILWPGGVAPTLTTTANKYDVFTFLTLGSGSYMGFTAGQSL